MERRETTLGYFYALAAYGAWGLSPLFWNFLVAVPAVEMLAVRICSAMLIFFLLLSVGRRTGEIGQLLRQRRAWATFLLTSLLIGGNWFLYVWAVNNGQILQASLGYFINPLLNVVLGAAFLGERLRPAQGVAVALAAAGVLNQASQAEGFPWIALCLAGSFAIYGLVRKLAAAGPLLGSNIETAFLVPPALAYLGYLALRGELYALSAPPLTWALLAGTGVMTALPLLWFSSAARRLPLTVLGFFQYIAPTGQFLLAVHVFGEPFTSVELRTFALIWTALALFTAEAQWARRRRRRTA